MRSCTSELKRVCSLVNAIVAPISSWKKKPKQLECHSSWVLSGWTVFLADPLTVFWQDILSGCQVCVWDIQYHLCSAYTGVEDSESCHVSFSEMDGSSCYASWHVGRCHLTNSTHTLLSADCVVYYVLIWALLAPAAPWCCGMWGTVCINSLQRY